MGSLVYTLPNNPARVYGANTFTQVLPASGRGKVFSGKIDDNLKFARDLIGYGQYNFNRRLARHPVVGGALLSTIQSRVRAQNF